MQQNLIQNARDFNTSDFPEKTDLANLKLDVDKLGNLDIDKLEIVPAHLSTLSEVVKNIDKNNKYAVLVKKLILFKLMTLAI